MSSVADLCVIPLQDYLGLGSEARINIPSTLGGNWCWRLRKGQFGEKTAKEMRRIAKLYGRLPKEEGKIRETEKPETEKRKEENKGTEKR